MAKAIEDFKKGCEILRKQGPPKSSPLSFTREQVDKFISEGENVNLDLMTINGFDFVFRKSFKDEENLNNTISDAIMDAFRKKHNIKKPS